jgi:hypothetical protein
MLNPFLLSRVLLHFDNDYDDLLENLSAATLTPDGYLWLGSDELTEIDSKQLNTIERLSQLEPCVFGEHQSFVIQDFLDLPNTNEEVDIESLSYFRPYLWVTGSHSTKRKKPKGKDFEKDLQRLMRIETESNRYLIARIPMIQGVLYRTCSDPDNPDRKLTAACLKTEDQENLLTKALKGDSHLGPFVSIALPSKENGFDIEGLAVHENRVFLGLRGPVLRGYAVLLELALEKTEPGVLSLVPAGETDQLYKKHFLELDGLGIRELCFQDDDLLILAGPTMDLAGSLRCFRLKNALDRPSDSVSTQDSGALKRLFELPYNPSGDDKAEGMALMTCLGQAESLLLVYDSPSKNRRIQKNTILADVFQLEC